MLSGPAPGTVIPPEQLSSFPEPFTAHGLTLRYLYPLRQSPPALIKMGVSTILLSLLVPVLVAALLLPKILYFVAGLVGRHLRRCSRTRRELLLARVANETKAYEEELKVNKQEDADWEQVGTTARDNAVKNSEWDGIVGFFHPFWYAWRVLKYRGKVTDPMFLQQCRRRRRASPLGRHSSTPKALAQGHLHCLYR